MKIKKHHFFMQIKNHFWKKKKSRSGSGDGWRTKDERTKQNQIIYITQEK
jgi:hypothetical protein